MSAIARPRDHTLTVTGPLRGQMQRFTAVAGVTLFATVVVSIFLMPLVYMAATAFKQEGQISASGAPIYPAVPATFDYEARHCPCTRFRPTTESSPGRSSSRTGRTASS
jgi:hypothetical protein